MRSLINAASNLQKIGHFDYHIFGEITSAPNDTKITLNATGSKVPYMC